MLTKIAACIGAVALALLAGCGHQAPALRPPATLTKIPGTTVQQVRLSGVAARDLGIETTAVRFATVAVGGKSAPHEVIPYAAVVYDTSGSSWAYVRQRALRGRAARPAHGVP
jgi:hypothetical protein